MLLVLLRSFLGEGLPRETFQLKLGEHWAMCCKKGTFVSEGAADVAGHCGVGCHLDKMGSEEGSGGPNWLI